MEWKVEELSHLKGYTIEWAEAGNYILSRRNILYTTPAVDESPMRLAVVNAPLWRAFASRLRLAQRLLRFLVTNVVPLANGDLFVTFDKAVGIVRDGKYMPLQGLRRPCRVLRSACALDGNNDVFFGEYLANDERREMFIYRYSAGSNGVGVVYTFPPNSIKHIHGVYFDKFTNSLVCLTGDNDSECRILRSFDGFKTVETIGEGDETWRAVSILFTRHEFLYGTDAEFRENQIFRIDRSDLSRTTVGNVSGTVFYSKRVGDDLFFTTTAENAPRQKENVAALWHVGANGRSREVVKFRKDRWHGTVFMFGTIHFPYVNAFSDKLYFSLVGVNGDNKTFCVRR